MTKYYLIERFSQYSIGGIFNEFIELDIDFDIHNAIKNTVIALSGYKKNIIINYRKEI